MAISSRKLRKWRAEALHRKENLDAYGNTIPVVLVAGLVDAVLELTQELLDNQLLEKLKGGDSTK